MSFPESRYDHTDYPEATSQAERFVDDTTLLRMMRLRMPLGKPEIAGLTSDTIKAIHLPGARLERWAKPEDEGTPNEGIVDVAFRFEDGSVAVRIRATQRWEVMRTW